MTEIFKVQLPGRPDESDIPCTPYCTARNKSGSIQERMPATDDMIEIMDGHLLAYFYGRVEHGRLILDVVDGEAPEQEW